MLQLASGDAWGGQERSLSLLAEAFRARSDVALSALLLNEGRLADVLRALGVEVTVVPEVGHGFVSLVRRVRAWRRGRRFDVVHAHRYKELLLAALLRRRDERLVLTVHGLEPSEQLSRWQLARTWLPLAFARLRGARIVAVSEELQRRLARRLGTARVVRIPNPMPRAPEQPEPGAALRASLDIAAGVPLVGFVGRLETVKGPDRFVALAQRCARPAAFVVVGGGSLEATLRRDAAASAPGRLHFTGEVPDALPQLAGLDLLVLTSRHEGLPIVLLEAAACEIPVVAFGVGGVGEVLDGSAGARIVAPGDLDALARAVEAALDAPELARRAARAWAAEVRRRFAPEAVRDAYLALYRAPGGR